MNLPDRFPTAFRPTFKRAAPASHFAGPVETGRGDGNGGAVALVAVARRYLDRSRHQWDFRCPGKDMR
ncbi:hypothetical protein ACQPZJ_24880 [Actinoplanes sp. CA-054009]